MSDLEPRYAAYVGRTAPPITHFVERGHVRRFAAAIGDENPIYQDEARARAAGHPRIPAPPTFAIALRANDPRVGLDIDWRRLVHGEQELEYLRPLYVGDELEVTASIVDAAVKETKAGVMDTLVVETRGHDPHGALIFRGRSTVLVRR